MNENELKELNLVKTFVEMMNNENKSASAKSEGGDAMQTALEHIRKMRRLEMTLRTAAGAGAVRKLRADLIARVTQGLDEKLQPKVLHALAFADFEVRLQMYFEFFRNLGQLPATAKIPVGPLAAEGKDLFLELTKSMPDDREMADDLKDIIEFYENAGRNPNQAPH
jgi:hypothetical protein